jgi:hypothetical protein
MGFMKKILTKLNGLHYRQEYLCLAKESFQSPIHAYLVNDRHIVKDITNEHLFTGYSPLILTFNSSELKEPFPTIEFVFSQLSIQPNDLFREIDALAKLSLRLVQKQKLTPSRFTITKVFGGNIIFSLPFASISSG